MKLRLTFGISLGLNFALAGAAVHLVLKTVLPTQRAVAATVSETTIPVLSTVRATSNSSASISFVTNRFAWGKIESEDFAQLATNLRAIGCPEKTIRDVVVARARRTLEQVSDSAESKLPFWTAGLHRAQFLREAERKMAAARAKILASVERAVGRDVFIEGGKMMGDFVEQAIVRFLSGPMPEERFSRLAPLLVRQESQRDEIRARTQGVWLEKDEAALTNLGRQFHRELAATLLPAELEEFFARLGMMELVEQVRFEATDLSLSEIREVALIRARFSDTGMGKWFNGSSLTDEQEARVTKAVRGFLGESRYGQIERAADSDFQKLFELGRDQNLPPDAAVKVFELHKLIAQEAKQLRADRALSNAAREQRLAALQAEAQQAVLQVLGANACWQYLGRGGAWLTNASRL